MKLDLHLVRRGGFRRVRRWLLGGLLVIAGCKSHDPSVPSVTSVPPEPGIGNTFDWKVPLGGPPNSNTPPPRLHSTIAPAPQPSDHPAPGTAGPNGSLTNAGALKPTVPAPGEKLYSFSSKDLELKDALALFARNNELNVVPDPDVTGQITVDFRNLTLEKSMEAILDAFQDTAEIEGGLIRVRKTQTEFYNVDYVRLNRTGNGSTSATISSGSVSSGGSGGGAAPGGGGSSGGSAGDSTSMSISKTDNIRFWDELEEQLKSMLSPDGRLAINRMVGSIMVTDHKANLKRTGQYLTHIKRALHLQVDIEAQIFEVVFDDEFHFGVDWQNVMGTIEKWAISSGGAPVGIPSSRLIVDNPLGGLQPGAPALSLAITKDQSKIVIDALKEQGRLEVVSQPRVRTLNNQAALIKVGTDKPFFRRTAITTTVAGAPPQISEDVQIQSITIGTVLALTPQISEDGWITLDISPVITRLVDTVEGPLNATAPEVDIKQATSLVRIRDNTTIVLGGLIQNERYKTERKVPLLGDIPILGYPFRGIFESKRRTELVIFITPTIVR